jgi:hypothetical protein
MIGLGLSIPEHAVRRRTAAGGGGASSFGYQAGDGTGTGVGVVFTSDHDATSYINDTGSDVLVSTVTILNRAGASGGVGQVALYADSSNAPGALLGVSNVISSMPTGNVAFTLSTPVNVTAGTRVWVAVRSENGPLSCDGGTRAADGRYRWKSRAGTSAFTDPFGASSTFAAIIPARLSS